MLNLIEKLRSVEGEIIQFDITQDFKGFVVFKEPLEFVDLVSKKFPSLVKSQNKQLMTCIQLAEDDEAVKCRVKVYNKSVHLLTSG